MLQFTVAEECELVSQLEHTSALFVLSRALGLVGELSLIDFILILTHLHAQVPYASEYLHPFTIEPRDDILDAGLLLHELLTVDDAEELLQAHSRLGAELRERLPLEVLLLIGLGLEGVLNLAEL
jgi:hypothetical protein